MDIKWSNTEQWNRDIHNEFIEKVNAVHDLKELRDFVEQNAFGFGERSFYWMWKLIVEDMPDTFTFLEIGVFRGQTLALIQLLAKMSGKSVNVVGVTPLDTTDGHWDSDYEADINLIHYKFGLEQPTIIKGLSTDPDIINFVKQSTFDIVYIDGGHSYEVAKSDIEHYAPLASKYLVIDDCANDLNIPFGMFAGIDSVTKAVKDSEINQKFLFNIVHIKVFKA